MSSREDTTLAGYVATLRRRKWIVILSVLVATASALFFASRQSKLYESSATVLLNPDPQLVSGAGRTAADAAARYDATQAQVAHTPQVASEAVHSADVSDINTQQLLNASAVSADATSNILTFKVSRQDPAEALALTNSFAQAFVDYRSATDSRVLDDRINQYDAQVRGPVHAAQHRTVGRRADGCHTPADNRDQRSAVTVGAAEARAERFGSGF